MPYSLGAFTFPSSEQPNDGENQWVQPQRWSKFEPIGASDPGTLLTYLSSPSIEQTMKATITTATRNSLYSIFNARARVLWFTPDDPTGYYVIMTDLRIARTRALRGTQRWDCSFTLVKQ